MRSSPMWNTTQPGRIDRNHDIGKHRFESGNAPRRLPKIRAFHRPLAGYSAARKPNCRETPRRQSLRPKKQDKAHG